MSKNSTSPFVRKIMYIACIGGLLIPLSMVSRPEIRDDDQQIKDPGGMLSVLRDQHNLSQAKISEVDPASETMKLASLGLRGVAVNVLWMQAMEHKKKEDYDNLAATLKSLTKIQPNFVRVWEYQAHNLAYNVSMEFDDYEYRYQWVTKGLDFLKTGVPYNRTDHRLTDNLGFMTGNKFGKSDEKFSFRRIFRTDDKFHQSMADFIDPEAYDTRSYGPDSWKMAWHWYDWSRRMVEEQSHPQYRNDLMFKMFRPSQTRNQAQTLGEEFKTDEIIQEIWAKAYEEWIDYGEQQLADSKGTIFTLERTTQYEKQLSELREQLDQFAPGARAELTQQMFDAYGVSGEERALLQMPADQLNDDEARMATKMRRKLMTTNKQMDQAIAQRAKVGEQMEAKRIADQILRIIQQVGAIESNDSVINYMFWRDRNKAESQDVAVRARQATFEAEAMLRRSIYDDEFEWDYKTKEKTVTRKGTISLYNEAFAKWNEVFAEYPDLEVSPLADQIIEHIKKYKEVLNVSGIDWPENFPLQRVIDLNSPSESTRGLPTSEQLEEIRSGQEDDEEEPDDEDESAEDESNEEEPADDESNEDEPAEEQESADVESTDDESADNGSSRRKTSDKDTKKQGDQ
jgi:hypothetical protein